MKAWEIIAGMVGALALFVFAKDKGIGTGGLLPTSYKAGAPIPVDLGGGLHATMTPDGGNGIPYAKEFIANDPKFVQRLRKATIARIRQGGLGKAYPYRTGNTIHDIGFPYMGAPLSYVSYPVGGSPENGGQWTPIEV